MLRHRRKGSAVNSTHEDRAIAVVRTRLPYTDRRSLSQAWFSALHLAAEETLPAAVRGERGAVPAAGSTGRPQPPPGALARGRPPLVENRNHEVGARVSGRLEMRTLVPVPDRNAPGGPAPRPAVAPGRSSPAFRTALTFGVAGERVQLLLRREGATLLVVALCRPAVEGLVRRALGLAAAQVRLSGDSVRADVQTTCEVRA
jgi:hypothetical protein